MELKCWQCGAAPTGLAEVTSFGDPEPRYVPTGWPDGDHEHDWVEPTPHGLLDQAAALREQRLRDLAR